MLRVLHALIDFCYIAHRNIHDMTSLEELQDALDHFHHHCTIFQMCGVHPDGFNLPWQHSLIHYIKQICGFGAPNGICSSIMESKHIKAVKELWQRSSCFEALEQMLLTNQRVDKLATAPVDFTNHGMLQGTCLLWTLIQLGTCSLSITLPVELMILYMHHKSIESRAWPLTCAPWWCKWQWWWQWGRCFRSNDWIACGLSKDSS